MAFKDEIDIKKVVEAASNLDGVPQSYLPFYKQRAIYLQRIGQKLLESKFSDGPRERDFLSAIQANPAYGSTTSRWASEGKFLRGFESHHGVPLKFNKLAMAYAPPAYHFKVGQYLKSNYDIEIGNVPNNRFNTHKVAHIGSKNILEGPGSVGRSLHPKGTNEGFTSYPSHKDVSPKEYSSLIASKNEGMIQTAKSVYNDPDGLIQGINKRIQFALDNSNGSISLKTAKPSDVFKAANKYRRNILDLTEADFGLGHRTLKAEAIPYADIAVKTVKRNPVGATVGAATLIQPEAIKSAIQGDYTEAAKQTAAGAVGGAVAQGVLKRVSSVAMRLLPKGGAMALQTVGKFAGPIGLAYAGVETLNAIVEGVNGEGNGLLETGVAAEAKKEELRKNGYSNHDLRRRYRNGYTK